MDENEFTISVAGMACRISSGNKHIISELKKEYSNFISKNTPRMSLKINKIAGNAHNVFRQNNKPVELTEPVTAKCKNNVLAASAGSFSGEFDLSKMSASLNLKASGEAGLISVRNFLRLCYALAILGRGGMMMHCSGIVNNNKGYIFSGPAGSGKSTIAKLSSGMNVLNDEMVVLKNENGIVKIYGTPFGGELKPSNACAELGKAMFIRHGENVEIERLSRAEAVSEILCNELLFMSIELGESTDLGKQLFKSATEMSFCIDAYSMQFPKSKSFWRDINGLEKHSKKNSRAKAGKGMKMDEKDPHKSFVNLTYRCNNNCISCIMEEHYQDDSMLTFESIKKEIDKILKNSSHIEFNGGEPTIRSDIFDILSYTGSSKRNAEIGLITNARLFSLKENIEKLVKLRLGNLKIITTIYGHNAALHDAITRTPCSFEQQIEGIKNLINAGVKIEIRVVINKINCRHLPEIAAFIADDFSPENFVYVNIINTKLTGQAKKNLEAVGVKAKEITPFLKESVETLESNGFSVRLSHFPHCILPENLRENSAGMSAEKTEVSFPEQCSECMVNGECSGVWKSYADAFGVEEFRPVKREGLYLSGKEIVKRTKSIADSDPAAMEKLLFLMGFKKVLRLENVYNSIEKALGALEGFPYVVDEKNNCIFISCEKKLAEKAKKLTNSFVISENPEHNLGLNIELGKLYGYPSCCARHFHENPDSRNEFYDFISFKLCDSIPEFPLFYIPCSRDCKATKELIERIKEKAKEIDFSGLKIEPVDLRQGMKIKKTVIFMGYSCNNNCLFCCNSERREHVMDEPARKIKEKILDAKKEGSTYLELIGGEPTIRKDIFDIVRFAKKVGFETIMFATNGRMFANREFAKNVIDAGVNQVVFSVHGHNAELHDRLTMVPGSFEQLKKGIENVKELGLSSIGANTTIVKQNYAHLTDIGRLIYSLGIRNSEFIFVDPTRGAPKKDFEKMVPTYEEVSPYVNRLLEFGKEKRIGHWHVRYYPLCFVDEKYHNRISETVEKKVFQTMHLAPDFVNKNAEKGRAEVGRVRVKKCNGCKYYDSCEGYWKEYAEQMGIK